MRVLRDLDNDGDLDLLYGRSDLGIARNDGRGFFAVVPAPPGGVGELDVGDFDGDGDLDAAIGRGRDVRFLTNAGNLTFVPGTIQMDAVQMVGVIRAGDFNGDGYADLVGPTSYNLAVFLNDTRGRLRLTQTIPLSPAGYLSDLELADLDGDGDLDLFEVNGNEPVVHLNDGTGRFTASVGAFPAGPTYASSAAFADFDGDGDLDLYLGTGLFWVGPPDRLYLNDGAGRFTDVTWSRLVVVPAHASSVAAADMDGDGDPDVLAFTLVDPGRMQRNLLRDASFRGPLRIGAPATLAFLARRGFATASQPVLAALTTRALVPPVRFPPLGLWQLDPQGLIFLPPLFASVPGGEAILSLTVPAEDGLVGQVVSMQAVVLHDPDPAAWRFTGVAQAPITR